MLEYVAGSHVEYSCKNVSNSFTNIFFHCLLFPLKTQYYVFVHKTHQTLLFYPVVCSMRLCMHFSALLFIKLNLYCIWALVGVRVKWSHVAHNKQDRLHTTQALLQAHSLNCIYVVEALSLRSLLWIFISYLNALWLWMTWSCLPWALTAQVHYTCRCR